ncbi:MAG: hypothetical protein J6S96_03570 [Muribaculaceae bacterium]|nr:hypothetical protein [Muribaculaceae bacterium]
MGKGYAQTEIPLNIPAPNAASLASYGNIPISYFSGQPSINIPLYTFNVRGLEMSILLTYDASGVQMNTLPGWTGHNWTLVAGGVITRTVHGNPDEIIYPQHAYFNFHNYFESHNLLPPIINSSNPDTGITDLLDTTFNSGYDLEPDIFTFSFMGHSGKFFLGNDGQWKVMSDDNLEIIYDVENYTNHIISPFIHKYPAQMYGNQPKTIEGFKIRDESGNIYEFGGDSTAIDYVTDFMRQTQDENLASWIATSWYLTRVTDRFGQELYSFSYTRGPFMAQFAHAYEVSTINGTGFWGFGNTHIVIPTHTNKKFPFVAQLTAPTYLSRITALDSTVMEFNTSTHNQVNQYTSPNSALRRACANASVGTVFELLSTVINPNNSPSAGNLFNYLQNSAYSSFIVGTYPYYENGNSINLFGNTGTKRLSTITIKNLKVNSCRKIKFLYTDNNSGNNNIRPFLRKLIFEKLYNSTDQEFMCYKMEYDHPELLSKDYLTDSIDHWGYFRDGKFSNISTLTTENWNSFYNSRAPSSTHMKYGSLIKLVYPTGGASTFEYEPNTYSSRLSANRQGQYNVNGSGAGLRIRSIKDYEDEECAHLINSRYFTYNNPGTTNSSGVLIAYPMYYFNWQVPPINGTLSIQTFRNTSIIPLVNSFGPSIGYTWVEEHFMDGSFIRHKFQNYPDIPYDILEVTSPLNTMAATPHDKFGELGFYRGKEKETLEFDAMGVLKRKNVFSYRSDYNTDSCVWGSSFFVAPGYATGTLTHYPGRFYRLFYQKYDLSSLQTTTYQNGDSSVVTISYTHNDHNINGTYFRTLDSQLTNRGNENQLISFVYSFNSNNSTNTSLFNRYFYLKPIRKSLYIDNDFIREEKTIFSSFNVNGQTHLLPSYETIKYIDNSVDTLVTYISYSNNGQPVQLQLKGEPLTTLEWNNDSCHLNYIKHGELYTYYNYDYFWDVITSITKPNKIKNSYEYNTSGQLSTIKDTYNRKMKSYDYNYRLKRND